MCVVSVGVFYVTIVRENRENECNNIYGYKVFFLWKVIVELNKPAMAYGYGL